jgi:hypothetical protein
MSAEAQQNDDVTPDMETADARNGEPGASHQATPATRDAAGRAGRHPTGAEQAHRNQEDEPPA